MDVSLLLPPIATGILLFLIRVIVAFSFFFSALNKAKNLKKSAKQNHLPLPVLFFVMCAEFAGALGVISGVLGQLAAAGLMLLMLATMCLHIFVWKSKYWASSGGWEYDLMLFALCGTVLVFGVGTVAL